VFACSYSLVLSKWYLATQGAKMMFITTPMVSRFKGL
jgi:hypothetical protein